LKKYNFEIFINSTKIVLRIFFGFIPDVLCASSLPAQLTIINRLQIVYKSTL